MNSSRSRANWLFCGGGYYRYDQGYTPQFDGADAVHADASSTRSSGPRTSITPARRSW